MNHENALNKGIRQDITDNYFENIVLSQNHFRPLSKSYNRNNNTIIFEKKSSSATRSFVKPNILQMNSSFVVMDINGEILKDTGRMLQSQGYKVKALNLMDMNPSHRYDPLHYCKDKSDIELLAECIIHNTSIPNCASDFFDQIDKILLCTCICAFIESRKEKTNKNFLTLCKAICEAANNNEKRESLYQWLEAFTEVSMTKEYLTLFRRNVPIKRDKDSFRRCSDRLSQLFYMEEIFGEDELELDNLGGEKTALFIIVGTIEDEITKLLSTILYTQLFNVQTEIRTSHNQIRIFINEFNRIGKIPELSMRLAIPSNISVSFILSDILQLKSVHNDQWKEIMACCSVLGYFGSRERTTRKFISSLIGVTSMKKMFFTRPKLQPLISPSKLRRLSRNTCIILPQGMKPVSDRKFDYRTHPRYSQTAEANPGFAFNLNTLF